MKATIVLTGDPAAQNAGAQLMLAAHRLAGTGFEMARLPFHVSLKQPFTIQDLPALERFFDDFAATVPAMDIAFDVLELSPNSAIGGFASGCLSLRAVRTPALTGLQQRLFTALTDAFGPCPAPHDDDYVFHMTVAIGGAPYAAYAHAHRALAATDLPAQLRFDRLALLYYDNDAIAPGSYFCYKLCELR